MARELSHEEEAERGAAGGQKGSEDVQAVDSGLELIHTMISRRYLSDGE